MEINITKFYNEAFPKDYSASVAEIGQNAGRITWQAANDAAPDWNMLDTPEKLEAMREFALSSGGWNEEEVAAWTDLELNALFVQWVAGDIRECLEWDCDDIWANYEELAKTGTVPSNLFKDKTGQIWFDLGF